MQRKRGISLIVLVITIIVMIILAAAIIVSLNNNNIIGKSKDAVDKTNLKQIQELAQTLWADAYIDGARTQEALEQAVLEGLKDVDTSKYTITVTTSGVDVTLNAKNEHGFYYDKLYVGTMTKGSTTFNLGMVFRESQSTEIYINGTVAFQLTEEGAENLFYMESLPSTYAKDKVIFTNEDGSTTEFTFENDGNSIDIEGAVLTASSQVIRGVYYNKYAIGTMTLSGAEVEVKGILNSSTSMEFSVGTEKETATVEVTANGHLITGTTINNVYVSIDGKHLISTISGTKVLLTFEEKLTVAPERTEISHSGTIPEGGIYYVGVTATEVGDYTGATETYTAGQSFPANVSDGDVYVYGDYEYRYNKKYLFGWQEYDWLDTTHMASGWGVKVVDTTKSAYGEVVSKINNKAVTGMVATYLSCTALTDLSGINIPSGVKNLLGTFSNCTSLTDLSKLTIPSTVMILSGTFGDCTSLTDISKLNIPSSVTSLESAFGECNGITKLDGVIIPNTVQNLSSMFAGCEGLVDASGLVISSGATDVSYMFLNCQLLEVAPSMSNCTNITIMSSMFEKCKALITAPDISNCIKLEDMAEAFDECYNLVTAPSIIPANVKTLYMTFFGCHSMTNTPDMSKCVNLENMYGTFYHCLEMKKAPNLSNCSKVTDMALTFADCGSLVSYLNSTDSDGDFSNYTIPSAVTEMGSTFDGCVGIVKAPDLGNCTQLLKMHSTFAECTNLVTGPETIPSNVDIMFSTFENCTALTGTIKINANPTEYWSCFEGTVNAIKISGSCSSTTKANLAGTAENGNVTY